jgi:hypothetical protein
MRRTAMHEMPGREKFGVAATREFGHCLRHAGQDCR